MTTPFARKIQKSINDSALFEEHIEEARELIEARQPSPSLLSRLLRRQRYNSMDMMRETAITHVLIQRKIDKLSNEFLLHCSERKPLALDEYLEREKESLKNQEEMIQKILGFEKEELEREVKNMETNRSRLLKSLRGAQKKVEVQKKVQEEAAKVKAGQEVFQE